MIRIEQRRQIHQFIILELAIQSLQKDYPVLETLKMNTVYLLIVESLLKSVKNDYYNLKRVLKKQKIVVVKWEKVDEYFSDVIITTAGEDEVLRYAQHALKSDVEELLIGQLKKSLI